MRFIFLFVFQATALGIFSQPVTGEVPIHFGQTFNNPQINPARGGSKAMLELFAGTRRSNEKFAGIATSAFSVFVRVNSSDKGFNVLGMDFNNDQEGPFISRNRGYISYARHQKIGDNCFFAGGISFGLYSFGVKANPAYNAGASGNTIDGNGGIFLYTPKTRLGLAINQFSNPKVQPIQDIIQLNRHYTLVVEKKIRFNESFLMMPSLFVRYIEKNQNKYMPDLASGVAVNFLLSRMVSFGASYEDKEGFYSFLGLQNVCVACEGRKKGDVSGLSVDFSYFMPNRSNYRTNTQTFEMVLRYYYGKGPKMDANKKYNAAACPDF